MTYAELEPEQKAILVSRLAGAYNARKMYVDDWMKKHNPEVQDDTLSLKNEKIAELIQYLQLRK